MYRHFRSKVRKLLTAYLRHKGFELSYTARALLDHPTARLKMTFAQILGQHFLNSGGIFFIQFGTFDGSSGDPIFSFVKRFRWAGILVEPQIEAFERLKKNYRDQPQLLYENVAVSDKEEVRTLYILEYPDDASWTGSYVSSFDRNHVERWAAGRARSTAMLQRSVILTRSVPCTTFNAICRKYDVNRIDLLQIDAEGFDAAIIRSIDFDSLKPRLIHYEHTCLPGQEQQECLRLLIKHGYKLCLEECDTTAYLEPGA